MNKLAKIVSSVLITGGLAGVIGGCESTGSDQTGQAGLALGLISGAHNNPAGVSIGNAMINYGAHQNRNNNNTSANNEDDVVIGTDIHGNQRKYYGVNKLPFTQELIRKANASRKLKIDNEIGQFCVVACKGVQDLDNNGFIKFPNEYLGQNYWHYNDEMMGIAVTFSRDVKKARVLVIDSEGKTITDTYSPPGMENASGFISFEPFTYSPGIYRARVYHINNNTEREIQEIEFEIRKRE